MDNEKIISAINKTGFPLENKMSSILKEHGWRLINNRYYIDDAREIEREIDILAYKSYVDWDNKAAYYTTLIISCKRSESSSWIFMTIDKPEKDPNFNYFVTINKTNDKRIEFMLKLEQKAIEEEFERNKNLSSVFSVERKVFGFQQINNNSYKPEDDKRIYDSIITTIKALEYEREIRPTKSNIEGIDTVFYNFNLLSIFDSTLFEGYFNSTNNITVNEGDKVVYINRHIVNKKECFYKIIFVNSETFDSFLYNYDLLNDANYDIYGSLIERYYDNIFLNKKKIDLFWSDFSSSIRQTFNYTVQTKYGYNFVQSAEHFEYNYKDECLFIYCVEYWDLYNIIDDIIKKLNADKTLIETIKDELKKYYRYEGRFLFAENELPF